MKATKYNFRREANISKSIYRMVMYPLAGSGLRGSYTDKRGDKVIVIYGYYDKPDQGLQMLRILANRYKSKIRLAMIYAKPGQNPNHDKFSELIEVIK